MKATRATYLFSIAAFLLGFALGGLSLHVASAQGVLGLKASMSQIGSALVEMQKNVDELQEYGHDQTSQGAVVFAVTGGWRCHEKRGGLLETDDPRSWAIESS